MMCLVHSRNRFWNLSLATAFSVQVQNEKTSCEVKKLRLVELNNYDEFVSLKKEWNELLSKSKENNIFSTWEWIATWWKYFGKKRKLLILLAYDQKIKLIAAAPLMNTRYSLFDANIRKIEFVGGESSDYHNFLLTEKEEDCIKLFVDYLETCKHEWDCVELKDIPETSKYSIDIISKTVKNSRKKNCYVCPYIILPYNFASYYSNLTSKFRKNIRRTLRRLNEFGKVEFEVIKDPDSIAKAMSTFLKLYGARWRKHLDEPFIKFCLAGSKLFSQKNWVNLSFLKVNGNPIASHFGFEYKQRFYFSLIGRDPAYSRYGIGHILIKFLIEYCIQNGMREFDFLKGKEGYKWKWTSTHRKTMGISIGTGLKYRLYYWKKNSDNILLERGRKLVNMVMKNQTS